MGVERARAFFGEVVLYRGTTPEVEARIAEQARAQTVALVRPLLLVAAFFGLLWWPFDFLLYAGRPEVIRAFAFWRSSVLVYCGVFYITCDRWAIIRRYPAVWGTALGAVITFDVAYAIGSLGPLEKPWFASLLMAPVMSFPFLLTPPVRLAGTSVIAAAGLAGYFLPWPGNRGLQDMGTGVGLMAFSVAVSTFAGHAIYHLYRVGLLQSEELAARSRQLEEQAAALAAQHDARSAELRLLAGHLEDLREVERRNLARDLHDDLGQLLTSTRLELDRAERVRASGGDVSAQHQKLVDLLDATLASTRSALSRLRPRILDDLGLTAALEWLALDTRRRSGLAVRFRAEPEEVCVPRDVAEGVFRIVQEALTNAQRHANARTIEIGLTQGSGGLVATIADDGAGLPDTQLRPGALGLLGMRERAAALGGALELSSPPGGGTRVTARFPDLRAGAEEPL